MYRYSEPVRERHVMTREDWLRHALGEIDPERHAGLGFYTTEEYATPDDVSDPFVREDVGREGEYYPSTLSNQDELEFLMTLLRRQ